MTSNRDLFITPIPHFWNSVIMPLESELLIICIAWQGYRNCWHSLSLRELSAYNFLITAVPVHIYFKVLYSIKNLDSLHFKVHPILIPDSVPTCKAKGFLQVPRKNDIEKKWSRKNVGEDSHYHRGFVTQPSSSFTPAAPDPGVPGAALTNPRKSWAARLEFRVAICEKENGKTRKVTYNCSLLSESLDSDKHESWSMEDPVCFLFYFIFMLIVASTFNPQTRGL